MYLVLSCLLLSLCASVVQLSENICHVGNALQNLFLFTRPVDFRNFKVNYSNVILECVKKDYLSGGTAFIAVGIEGSNAFCVEQGSTDGFAFTSIARWPKKLAGACEDHKCPSGYTCVPLTIGSTCRQLGKPEAESCGDPTNNSCDVSEKETPVRKSYDCTLNTTVQYTRIVATSHMSRLHIFNHTIQNFETFDKKVYKHSEYVVDFIYCQVIYVFKKDLATLGLNRNTFHKNRMNAHMRLLKFFQSSNKLGLVKRDGKKDVLCLYKSNLKLRLLKSAQFNNVTDMSFSKDGESIFVIERHFSGSVLKELKVYQQGPVEVIGRSEHSGVIMQGLSRVARWVPSSHTLVVWEPGKVDVTHFLTQDVSEIRSSLHGNTYLVDTRRMLYAYDSHMKLMWKISLSHLYGHKTDASVRFYIE